MTVVVFGGGAVGSLFAARLAAGGVRVCLVARPEHVAAIRAHGLRVEGEGAGTTWPEATTSLDPSTAAEAVLVTVKTFDLPKAMSAVGHGVRPAPTLLPQNGIGFEAEAVRALAAAGWTETEGYVVRAVHSVPATWLRPGVVRAAGSGEVVLPSPTERPRLARAIDRFAALFAAARIPVRLAVDFDREVWRKLLVNAAINPVTAAHGVVNGRLRDGPLRAEAERLLAEALAVALAVGVDVSAREAEDDLDRVLRATAENRSSMLQDVDRGRATEIDAISGEIVRLAEHAGVAVPATRAALRRLSSRPRPPV